MRAVGGPAGILAGLAAEALALVVLGGLLRILPGEDAVWLDHAVGMRFGGLLGRMFRLWASGRPSSPGL